jgi:hypothetical protein
VQYQYVVKIEKFGHKVRVWMLREPLRSPTPKKPVPKIAEFAANRKIAFFSAETHNASNPASHVTGKTPQFVSLQAASTTGDTT